MGKMVLLSKNPQPKGSFKDVLTKSAEELSSTNIYGTRSKNGWEKRAVENGLADDRSYPSSVSSRTGSSVGVKEKKADPGFAYKEEEFPSLNEAAARKFKI